MLVLFTMISRNVDVKISFQNYFLVPRSKGNKADAVSN
jgi:hypothetical protein